MLRKKNFHCEIKKDRLDERIISGLASTYSKDLGRDRILRGAFKKTIEERFTKRVNAGKPPQIKVLWQHDQTLPIGKILVLEERPEGLYFEAYLSEVQKGDECITLVRDEVIAEMSIGFTIIKAKPYDPKERVQEIEEIKLYEVSPVTFPMNEEAEFGLKDMDELKLCIKNELLEELKTALQEERSNEQKVAVAASHFRTGVTLDEIKNLLDTFMTKQDPPTEPGSEDMLCIARCLFAMESLNTMSMLAYDASWNMRQIKSHLMTSRGLREEEVDEYYAAQIEIETKAGRMISAANEKFIRSAYESTEACSGALKALLDKVEEPTSDTKSLEPPITEEDPSGLLAGIQSLLKNESHSAS